MAINVVFNLLAALVLLGVLYAHRKGRVLALLRVQHTEQNQRRQQIEYYVYSHCLPFAHELNRSSDATRCRR